MSSGAGAARSSHRRSRQARTPRGVSVSASTLPSCASQRRPRAERELSRTGHAPVRIGTRGSKLALVQAELVQSALRALGADAELVIIKTTGDKKLDEPLSAIGA